MGTWKLVVGGTNAAVEASARARAAYGEALLWWCTTGTPSTVPLALYKVRHFELPHCRREGGDRVGFERWGKGLASGNMQTAGRQGDGIKLSSGRS